MSSRLFEDVWLEGRLESNLDAVYRDSASPSLCFGPRHAPALSYTKLTLARAAGRMHRAACRGGGTAAPGRLLLRLAPRAIEQLARRLAHGAVVVSGTNGKTTTARMLASILRAGGHRVVHNREGANTHWGVATALANQSGDIGVFEVDEAWLPLLCAQLRPRLLVLGNLFRDRLDGYGELNRLSELWRELLCSDAGPPAVVANADDPLLCGPGGPLEETLAQLLLFGIDDGRAGRLMPSQPCDANSCACCGAPIEYTRAFVGHLGHYRCAGCGRARPAPRIVALEVNCCGLAGTRATIAIESDTFELALSQPGIHNVYNALAAAAAGAQLGMTSQAIRAGLQSSRAAFGRSETITLRDGSVHLLLVKNPAGVGTTLRLLRDEAAAGPLDLWLALNDNEPDGRDVSWIWDADYEQLAGAVRNATCSGIRASELAMRLKYAGWDCELTVEHDLGRSLRLALGRAGGTLYALPTYTALLGLRPVLNRLGAPATDWGRTAALAAE